MRVRYVLMCRSLGGEGGIRTHGPFARSQHFQCCRFGHSRTSPNKLAVYVYFLLFIFSQNFYASPTPNFVASSLLFELLVFLSRL